MELTAKDIKIKREMVARKKEGVESLLKEFDFNVDKISPEIIARLKLLDELTDFVEDERRALKDARLLFDYLKENKTEFAFSPMEERTTVGGIIFSDIGKTGPKSATESQQKLIIKLYGVEDIKKVGEEGEDGINTASSLAEIIRIKFPNSYEEDMASLKTITGINPDMPINKLWRMHAKWTKEIIEEDGIPREYVASAAIHHILEGDNQELINPTTEEYTQDFGENKKFTRDDKAVILLDKYEAGRERAGLSHEDAIEMLRKIVNSNEHYRNDGEFTDLIEDMDNALRKNSKKEKID